MRNYLKDTNRNYMNKKITTLLNVIFKKEKGIIWKTEANVHKNYVNTLESKLRNEILQFTKMIKDLKTLVDELNNKITDSKDLQHHFFDT